LLIHHLSGAIGIFWGDKEGTMHCAPTAHEWARFATKNGWVNRFYHCFYVNKLLRGAAILRVLELKASQSWGAIHN
jgi:hypothetical protein